jgi:hypothetical protein
MLTGPSAKRFSAFAAAINRVREANLQNGLLWLLRSFLDAQRKRVEIEDGISVVHQHRYASPGRYIASVERTNERGESAVARLVIEVVGH